MGKKNYKVIAFILTLVIVAAQFTTVFAANGFDKQDEWEKRQQPEVTKKVKEDVQTETEKKKIKKTDEKKTEKDYVIEEKVVVKYKDGTTTTKMRGINASFSAKSSMVNGSYGVGVLEFNSSSSAQSAVNQLRKDPTIEFIEPIYIYEANAKAPSNDPGVLNNWQWGLDAINVYDLWEEVDVPNRTSTAIAIIDTGIDLDHPDLEDSIITGYDFVNEDEIPDDDDGHGTHVAGIAAAISDNGIGVAGVAGGTKIMPVKVLNEHGKGNSLNIYLGIRYAVDNGADVINLSLGGPYPSLLVKQAIDYAIENNVIVVASTGNDYTEGVEYPAAFQGVIGVGAVDWNNNKGFTKASFSNYGPQVDLVAPGVDIYSTHLEGSYSLKSGTSMATPFVAGYAALLKADDPSLTNEEIQDMMEENAKDLGNGEYFGAGLICLDGSNDITEPILYKHIYIDMDSTSNNKYTIDCKLLDFKYETSDQDGTYYLYLGEYENEKWISQPRTLTAIEVDNGSGFKEYDFSDEGVGTYGLYVMDPNDQYLSSDIEEITIDPTVTINLSLPEGKTAPENGYDVTVLFREVVSGETISLPDNYHIASGTSTVSAEIVIPSGTYTVVAIIDDDDIVDLYYDTIFYNDQDEQSYIYYEGIEDELQTNINADTTINMEFKTIQHKNDAYGDNIETATNQESNFTITDAIDYCGDIDFLKINLDSAGTYCASFTNTNMYLEVTLYDNTGEWIEKYSGYQDIYFTDLLKGTYYLSVTGYIDTELGSYTLAFKSAEDDHKDTLEEATVIDLDTEINAGIDWYNDDNHKSDVDMFKFTVPQDGNYIIRSYGETDLKGLLYDSLGTYRLYSIDGNFYIDKFLTGKTYYLGVSGYQIGKYSIEVITDDYGDYYDTAEDINIGTKIDGTINDYLYDQDFFKFNITESGRYIMTSDLGLEGAIDTFAWLYNESNEYITCSDNGGKGLDFKIVEDLTPGQYYLIVEGHEEGNYQIIVKPDTEVTFEDTNFEAAIREVLGFEDNEDIYSMDCLDIKVLDLSNKGIKDISDLTYFKNVLTVDLSNNQITTIPNLDLESLWALDLSNNQITDISGVSGLSKLGELYLSNNNISDMSALSGLDLISLMINSNNISDITPIQEHKDLKVLYMKDNNITDVSPISSYCKKLEDKDFAVNPSASNVGISGTKKVGETLTLNYTYSNQKDDAQQGSIFQWLVSSTSDGQYTKIKGAISKTYKLTSNEKGKYVKAEVTPKSNANEIGLTVISSSVGPIEKQESSSPDGGGGGGGGAPTPTDNDTSKEVEKNSDGRSTLIVKPAEGKTIIDATWEKDVDKIDVVIPQNTFDTASKNKKLVVVETNKVKMEIPTEAIDKAGDISLGISELSLKEIKVELEEAFANVNEDALVFDFDLSVNNKIITKFNEPLTITIDFDTSKVTDKEKLGVYYYNESEKTWEYVGGKVNENGKITFTIDHFSKYAVMEYSKTFGDIQNHWAKKQIENMASKHITKGITEDLFAPEKVTTRAEFTTWLVRALDLDIEKTKKIFNDVSEDEWFFGPINKAYEVGIINGVGKNVFVPQKQITREEMASLIMRAYEYSTGTNLNTIITTQEVRFNDMDDASSWATRNITLANSLGLISGYVDGTFKPAKSATRAEAMAVISRLVNEIE